MPPGRIVVLLVVPPRPPCCCQVVSLAPLPSKKVFFLLIGEPIFPSSGQGDLTCTPWSPSLPQPVVTHTNFTSNNYSFFFAPPPPTTTSHTARQELRDGNAGSLPIQNLFQAAFFLWASACPRLQAVVAHSCTLLCPSPPPPNMCFIPTLLVSFYQLWPEFVSQWAPEPSPVFLIFLFLLKRLLTYPLPVPLIVDFDVFTHVNEESSID